MDEERGERELTKKQRAMYVRRMNRARKALSEFFQAAYKADVIINEPMKLSVDKMVLDCLDCERTFEYPDDANPWYLYTERVITKGYCDACAQRRKDKEQLLEAL